jgi:CO/xanthine dehydrogenase FAD-binding subunit
MLDGRRLDEAAAITAGEAASKGADPRPGTEFKVRLLQRAVTRALLAAGGIA